VTHLDDALIRMVATELTGKRAPVSPEQLVRVVGDPDAHGTCKVQETAVVAF
jgi:hypothetical protein